jgi:adenine-specific DNA-methyltransferase
LRGKTGLIPDEHKKSDWSTREGCVPALQHLIESADASHVAMSYNNEGIIPAAEIERIFRTVGRRNSYRCVGRDYSRYRADSDSDVRVYKSDQVTEFLYYVRLR